MDEMKTLVVFRSFLIHLFHFYNRIRNLTSEHMCEKCYKINNLNLSKTYFRSVKRSYGFNCVTGGSLFPFLSPTAWQFLFTRFYFVSDYRRGCGLPQNMRFVLCCRFRSRCAPWRLLYNMSKRECWCIYCKQLELNIALNLAKPVRTLQNVIEKSAVWSCN